MENKKLGLEPAFPSTDGTTFADSGISKRLYITTCIAQGLMGNSNYKFQSMQIREFVANCYIVTDEILKQENL